MQILTIPAGTPQCAPDMHTWTQDVYVPGSIAKICDTCGAAEFVKTGNSSVLEMLGEI